MSLFAPAVKEEARLRLAIAGPSGSGKTYTSLSVALALGKRVALVDTEHGSASKYADLFAFDVAAMHPPFHPEKFIKAIQAAGEAGYDVLILDSLSHAWNGDGGLLDLVEEFAKRMKNPNSFAAWKDATPIQNRLIEAIVGAPLHIIATMRSKTEYILQDSGNGKQVPRKVGMAPVQRDGFEYEFDVFLDMDIDNNAIVSKTRCSALNGRVLNKPGKDLAGILATWLNGKPVKPTNGRRGVDWEQIPERVQPGEIQRTGQDDYEQHIIDAETEPAAPSTLADIRASLEEIDIPSVGNVVAALQSTGLYNAGAHALNAAKLWPSFVDNDKTPTPRTPLKTDTALALFDWLVSRKQAADSANDDLFD